jgi:hypothetical protein
MSRRALGFCGFVDDAGVVIHGAGRGRERGLIRVPRLRFLRKCGSRDGQGKYGDAQIPNKSFDPFRHLRIDTVNQQNIRKDSIHVPKIDNNQDPHDLSVR